MSGKGRTQKERASVDVPFAAPDWPAARGTIMVKVAKITPHPENPRIHPDTQIDGIAASYEEFGVVVPPVVDEKFRLLAGEGRWLTAKKKGFEELPCIQVRGWDESKKRRFMVADNRLAALALMDDERYKAVLTTIAAEGYSLEPLGFDQTSLDAIIDGWNADGMPGGGENLEGISAAIKISVQNADKDRAIEVIEKALKRAQIAYEI